jgi:hypothetical protein
MSSPLRAPSGRLHLLACVIGLGLFVAWASLALRIHTRADSIHNLWAILHGQPLVYGQDTMATLPFYNRVMFPGMHGALTRYLPMLSPGQWYVVLRVVTCWLAFAAFAFACRRSLRSDDRDLGLAATMLAISTVATFAFGLEDPSDALDVCSLALAVLTALEGRFVACLLVAILFASNRESAAYTGPIWFLLSARPHGWIRRGIEAAVIAVASYATAIGLRLLISTTGTSNFTAVAYNWQTLMAALRDFVPINWLPILLTLVLTFLVNIDRTDRKARAFILLSAAFAVPAAIFGHINELRVFLPCFVMLSFAVAVGSRTRSA